MKYYDAYGNVDGWSEVDFMDSAKINYYDEDGNKVGTFDSDHADRMKAGNRDGPYDNKTWEFHVEF